MNKSVVIVQELLPEYRIPFFNGLRKALDARGVNLALVHGRAEGARAARRDEGSLSWARRITNVHIRAGRSALVWQPALQDCINADLVIVEQANRLLLNYILLLTSKLRRPPLVAVWGHGANLQSNSPDGVRERWKGFVTRQFDYAFAYTEKSALRYKAAGVAASRITVVNNTVAYAVPGVEGRGDRNPYACIFVGALDFTKRLGFLLEAADICHDLLPQFHLDIVGDGALREIVVNAQTTRPWIRFYGYLPNAKSRPIIERAQLMLMPGLVGLAVVDAFAAATPMIATHFKGNSPESEYILHEEDGLLLAADTTPEQYARTVVELLQDDERLRLLRRGCVAKAADLAMDGMVDRYAKGVLDALEVSRLSPLTRFRSARRRSAGK